MFQSRLRPIDYFIGAFLGLFFLVGKPVEFGQENSFFHGFLIKNPVIRIGLGMNLSEMTIRSSSGMHVYEVNSGYRLLASDSREIHLRGQKEKLSEKFVVQVAQTTKKAEAERLARELGTRVLQRVYVTSARDALGESRFQVRVGDFSTRGEALRLIRELQKAGYEDVWILREEITAERAHALEVFVENERKVLDSTTVIYFIPANPESYLSYNETQYRGIFVLRASPKGLVLVNILNLDDYLLGVVPCELSPDKFKSFEALKAQAVAARTYAVKNLGLNRDLGFDLCDSPQCQVYGGLSAEHPLSSRAVLETRGEVATYKGKLINALYTSTCGGRTEDAEKVFGGQPQAYLQSTECVYEKQKEFLLEGRGFPSVTLMGRNLGRPLAVLVGLGVLPAETDPVFYAGSVTPEEVEEWTRRCLALLGKDRDPVPSAATNLNFSRLAAFLVEAFGWRDRADHLMLKSEVDFLLRGLPSVKGEDRNSLAYLIHSGVFLNSPGMADEARVVTRGELAFALYRALTSYADPGHSGVFVGLGRKNELEVEEQGELRRLALSPGVFLFRRQEGEIHPASRLTLLGGEDIRWVEHEGSVTVFEASFPTDTPTLDRGSVYHRWQVRLSREELERKINEYYPVGRLIDLRVESRGTSHRVIALSVIGEEGQPVVRGLKIRSLLGLRDTLFALDREYDAEGRVSHFVFTGRGWGHGVGLCQVGAFRMGQAGANYQEILKKYYRNIRIVEFY